MILHICWAIKKIRNQEQKISKYKLSPSLIVKSKHFCFTAIVKNLGQALKEALF